MATLTTPLAPNTTYRDGAGNLQGAQCDSFIANQYDTFGTLTKAAIDNLSVSAVKAIYTDGTVWREIGALISAEFEIQLCGIERKDLFDWVMASYRPGMSLLWQPERQHMSPSLVKPYISARQIAPVNDQYWILSTGFATGSYTPNTTGPLDAVTGTVNGDTVMTGARVFRLQAAYGVPLSAMYFLPRHFLFVLNNSSGGSALHGQWQIIDSALADDGTYVDVLVNIKGPDTTTVDTTPVTGVVIVGTNSVHNAESYCRNAISVNPQKRIPFWVGVRRWGRRISSAYLELLKHLTGTNQWFREFQDLPINERNRQDERRDRKEWVQQVFWGRSLTPKQNLNQWFDAETTDPTTTGLRRIKSLSGATIDPGTGDELQEFEAMPIGIYDQLKGCGQVWDLQGAALPIRTLINTKLYDLWRNRDQAGKDVKNIRLIMDSLSAVDFMKAMVAYHKFVFGADTPTMNIEQGSDIYGFSYRKFTVPERPYGVTLEVATHLFFDDQLNAFSGLAVGQQNRGRMLMAIDMGPGGSIYPAILKSDRVVHVTGELQKLAAIEKSFACVMENPTYETTMTSTATTTVVECPLMSLWAENFSSITGPA